MSIMCLISSSLNCKKQVFVQQLNLCIMFGSIAFVLEMQSNSPSSPMLMLAEVELSLDDPQVISEHC
jgi:hypothetical protein